MIGPNRRWRRTAAARFRSMPGENLDAPFTRGLAFPAAVAQLFVQRSAASTELCLEKENTTGLGGASVKR